MFQHFFPLFSERKGLIYLDSASTTQKPKAVIESVAAHTSGDHANIHRGSYILSERSEEIFEHSKKMAAHLLGASHHEIVYTYNATAAANLIAQSLYFSGKLKTGDVVLVSQAEHHANLVPWFLLRDRFGVEVRFVNVDENGYIDVQDFQKKYDTSVKVVSFTYCSNMTGAVMDLPMISALLREDTLFVVDASQAVPNFSVDVRTLDCDFLFFSAHKMMAHTGLGVLYGKKELLKEMQPAWGGGGAINWVKEEGFSFAGLPFRWEPGTANIIGAVSLDAALTFFQEIGGYEALRKHEDILIRDMLAGFARLSDRVRLFGPKTPENRVGVFSFALPGMHARDVADAFAEHNICVRAGHHCTQPLHEKFGVDATCRASLYLSTTREDIQQFFTVFSKILSHVGA